MQSLLRKRQEVREQALWIATLQWRLGIPLHAKVKYQKTVFSNPDFEKARILKKIPSLVLQRHAVHVMHLKTTRWQAKEMQKKKNMKKRTGTRKN